MKVECLMPDSSIGVVKLSFLCHTTAAGAGKAVAVKDGDFIMGIWFGKIVKKGTSGVRLI